MASTGSSLVFGGYSGSRALLGAYNDSSSDDLSDLVEDMTYVNWIGYP
jgi:hypothetical protein